jgi:alpha-1,2-mannosyltransferase
LVYNAIGGSGDELYGVEPASYYVRNLFLNLGFTFPLALLGVVTAAICLLTRAIIPESGTVWKLLTVCACALAWLGILLSRPHKVRFSNITTSVLR